VEYVLTNSYPPGRTFSPFPWKLLLFPARDITLYMPDLANKLSSKKKKSIYSFILGTSLIIYQQKKRLSTVFISLIIVHKFG